MKIRKYLIFILKKDVPKSVTGKSLRFSDFELLYGIINLTNKRKEYENGI